jgi:hypothetical protein
MNATLRDHPAFRAEALRLKGERAPRSRTLDVFDPYTGTRVGLVNVWEVPWLPDRADAVRRHQGFGPWL